MKAVSSGTTPIQPQSVCGPVKTNEIRPRPTTIRRIRSIEPTFFDSMACILFHLENMPESCAAGSRLSVTKSAFEKSGRVQSLSIGVNGAVEHQADHGQGDHRFGDLWQLFVILGEAPPSSEPAKCSFDHPPARQGNKAGGPCDRSHNDQGQAEQETGQEDSGAVVDTVSEHHLEPAVEWLDFAQKIPGAIGVLDVRGVDKAQQQAGGVYGNVALAAFDL